MCLRNAWRLPEADVSEATTFLGSWTGSEVTEVEVTKMVLDIVRLTSSSWSWNEELSWICMTDVRMNAQVG